ncbi:Exportin-7 [Vitis vinifera]|uniref:Exportin-7 n=1 Tax=Vitis vinifera TaxID=29760 RepID=A0A438IB85_VITVI|nr:Exportin-7 [Vitis vinifera]
MFTTKANKGTLVTLPSNKTITNLSHSLQNLSNSSKSIGLQIFTDLKAQILASQPVDQHQRLSLCFDKLMADVNRSLDSKNRDKFTQNLTIFRHEFRVK